MVRCRETELMEVKVACCNSEFKFDPKHEYPFWFTVMGKGSLQRLVRGHFCSRVSIPYRKMFAKTDVYGLNDLRFRFLIRNPFKILLANNTSINI